MPRRAGIDDFFADRGERRDTERMLLITLIVLAVASLPLARLTASGAHRRGLTVPRALLAGLAYLLTWLFWYVKDERPYRRVKRHAA
jgi:sensor c-di-GMP phosphodiesterase-like protein